MCESGNTKVRISIAGRREDICNKHDANSDTLAFPTSASLSEEGARLEGLFKRLLDV